MGSLNAVRLIKYVLMIIDQIHDENNNTPFMNKRMSNLFYVL